MKLKKIVGPVWVLLGMSAVLWGTVWGTKTLGERKKAQENQQMMAMLLPGSASFEPEAYDGEDANITSIFKGENGYVIETTVAGYVDDIVVWTGIDNEGYVTGVTIRDMAETYGLGMEAMHDLEFLNQFLGTRGDVTMGETVDAITGATVTSKALAKAVNASAGFVSGADVTSSATEW